MRKLFTWVGGFVTITALLCLVGRLAWRTMYDASPKVKPTRPNMTQPLPADRAVSRSTLLIRKARALRPIASPATVMHDISMTGPPSGGIVGSVRSSVAVARYLASRQ